LSSVNAALCMDLNGDGIPDLVLGGNEFGFLPQFGRLDASFGHVLLGKGHGQFQYAGYDTSGLQLPGQIRDITPLPAGKKQMYLLFLRNDDYPALYRCMPMAIPYTSKIDYMTLRFLTLILSTCLICIFSCRPPKDKGPALFQLEE